MRRTWFFRLPPSDNVQFFLASLLFLLANCPITYLVVINDNAPIETPNAVCPLNLTEKLPCICHVLSNIPVVQIICDNVEPDQVWGTLGGYSTTIDKISVRNCPNKTDVLQPIHGLKIRSLEIFNCSIAQIHPTAFDLLAGTLEELRLPNNALTSAPKLGKLKRLRALSLSGNALKELPDHTLLGLKQLKQLRLRGNQICTLVNPLIDQKNSLELLDLGQNCFTAVPAATLRGCLELKHLSLAGNMLNEIGSMQFMSLPKLVELRLHGNRLQRIQPSGFMNVQSLQLLFLQNNSLSSFDPGTLQTFKQLRLVDLSLNAFTKIPSFKDMAQLVEVRLEDNQIGAIETLTFSSNPNLRKILLARNQIDTIAKNSFDSLDQMELLDLADNSLATIGRGMFGGLPHLKDLVLRNNSIDELSRDSFSSTTELISVELSHNELATIRSGTFSSLQRLHLLKLDNNKIETIEKGAFDGKVDTVLLDGNKLRCDAQLDWFLDWLVKNKVRTFVPDQPEIKCASPDGKKGVRLKDLMIERNNVTEALLNSLHGIPGFARGTEDQNAAKAGNLLANLIPGVTRQTQGTQIGSQMLNSLAQSFPEIRNMPGMRFLPPIGSAPQTQGGNGKTLDSAIDQFSEPLVKFASGAQPSQTDINQMLSSIPSLVVSVPGFGNVDVSKLNPSLVEYVLKGGQIPGIPRETLNHIVKQYMQKMYVAAAQVQGIQPTDMPPLPMGTNTSRILRPISELPNGLVQSVMDGKPLPHLTTEQTNVIKQYYTQHAPIGDLLDGNGDGGAVNMSGLVSPRAIKLMQLLPRNYNLSNLSPEIVQQVMQGKMPDLTKLPIDLQQYIKDNFERLFSSLVEDTPGLTIEEIMRNLPKFEQPTMSTFSPYDINSVDADLVIKQKKAGENARFWRLCAAISLGLAGAITLGVISAFCWYWQRNRAIDYAGERSNNGGGAGALPSVVREQSFRPSASSTLK